MDEIKLGLIGCGYWGPNLLRNYVELSGVTVSIVADASEDRLNYVRHRFPSISVTTDYRDLFTRDLDAAIIATPPVTHYPIARDCLEHGLHVLVEKPMTQNSADALSLIELSHKNGRILMTGHTFEYNPAVNKLKEVIHSGDLGTVYYVNSVRANLGLFQWNSDVVWDLAPHDISIFLYLLDRDPLWVSALGEACVLRGTYDLAYLHVQFSDNVSAHAHISWLDPCKVRQITVVGSHKMVVYDDTEAVEKLRIYEKSVEPVPRTDNYGEFRCIYHYGDVVIPHIDASEPLRIECQHFIDSIRSGVEPRSNGYDGWKVVTILEAAQRSLKRRGEPEQVQLQEATVGRAVV